MPLSGWLAIASINSAPHVRGSTLWSAMPRPSPLAVYFIAARGIL